MNLDWRPAPLARQDRHHLFRTDVLRGLTAASRSIPPRWFYDDTGYQLFEAITRLPEYYPYRAEARLLERHAATIAAQAGPVASIVEFGAGSSTKTPLLLRALGPSAYVPIDIAGDHMRHAAALLATTFPALAVTPIEADFLEPVALPPDLPRRRLGFFPGSTIGNFDPDMAVDLLRRIGEALGPQSLLLIGIDHLKDSNLILPAYDDDAGITARFNRNLLDRINRELGGDIPTATFRHRAIWNERLSRVEMHLEAMADVAFSVAGRPFSVSAGETLHTENSYKYGLRDARMLLRAARWEPLGEWSDPDGLFLMILAENGAPITS